MKRRRGGEENWAVGFPSRPVHPVKTGLITGLITNIVYKSTFMQGVQILRNLNLLALWEFAGVQSATIR